MSNLDHLREQIDSLDAKIVALLNERATVSVQVGKAKAAAATGAPAPDSSSSSAVVTSSGPDPYVPRREREVFETVVHLNKGPLPNEAIVAIYREVMSASISLQQQVAIAFLGPAGTHSHQAAMDRFGDSVLYVPMPSIADVFSAVEQGRALYGVVPFENSTSGSVAQTLDRFLDSPLQIRAETYLPIHHALLSLSHLTTIRRVYSHPEALGQCQRFLETAMPHAERVPVSSTAHAAELAAKEPYTAAICNAVCAPLYGLTIVAPRVEDAAGNTTRFLVLARDASGAAPSDRDKTLLCFTVDHRVPGALCDALRVFKDCGINLTRIDSRPDRLRNARAGLWHYCFLVELVGHRSVPAVVRALEELGRFCVDLKVLGSYPIMEGTVSAAPASVGQ
ncbi:prephenate dehydratase domain protein [Blastocladiella britannica]|nr:prephenate dehydratase domain protein [Blastocladiella britannica]